MSMPSRIHMWTAPPCKNSFDDFDRIACVHMSGLLVRSHMNAGQDGFRDVGSKQCIDHVGPLDPTECPASRIDRSHHLLVSCKFTHQFSTVASVSCSPLPTDFVMPRRPEPVAQHCPYRLRRSPSFSRRSWRSCWPVRQPRVLAACA